MTIQLSTTEKDYRALLKIVNDARGEIISRIPKQALWNLLRDHEKLNGAVARRGLETTITE